MKNMYQYVYDRASQQTSDSKIADSFSKIITFLSQNPDRANGLKQTDSAAWDEYIDKALGAFLRSRQCQRPSISATIPDPMIGIILNGFYEVPVEHIPWALDMHMKAMGAENITGYLLELYIAQVLEPKGWVWCSAPFVKAIDFIKPDANLANWELLQVKNRDNSENSSSAAIRNGTQIQKWFRTFSKTGATNWQRFPDIQTRALLSEDFFHSFVNCYLSSLKEGHNY